MRDKCLFLVNTPYQLMISINLRKTEYINYEADIVITDNIANYNILADSVKNVGIFKNVILYNIKDNYPDSNIVALTKRIFGDKDIFNNIYDVFLFANLDHGASGVYRMIYKKNKRVEVVMFEDGYATYSEWYSDFLTMFGSLPKKGDIYKRAKYKIWFHKLVDNVFGKVKKIFVFNPELMTYYPSFNVEYMKPIDTQNKDLVNIFNKVFKYDPNIDSYNEPYIFFEESYYADGYDINDVELVKLISDIVGKENIFIKTHPRNPYNRFSHLGYKTNTNSSIPWEVICMNMDLSDKTLITIASVAAIVPAVMLGKKYNGILLMKLLPDDSCLKNNITNLYEDICSSQSCLHFVNTIQELSSLLKKNKI